MKALIIEDNPSLAQSLHEFLSQKGWETHLSPSWKSALDFLDKNSAELLILDILLPDKKGYEILEILSQQQNNPFIKVALISGFIDETSILKKIPKSLKDYCAFFKKPIDEKNFSNFLETISFSETHKSANSISEFFLEEDLPKKALNFCLPKGKIFDSKELIPIVFFAHLKKFTGQLQITTNKTNRNSIKFYKGNIIKFVSTSEKAFFGNLLVEHGLCLQEDIQNLLNNKESNKFLGEKLVEKKLLNPYMLSFILKEQVKVRLSEIMSYPSVTLKILEKPSENGEKADIDFNETDFIEWLADSSQTELTVDFLKTFFMKSQHRLIQKSSQLNKALISQKQFLQEYNQLFKSLNEGCTVKDIASKVNNKNRVLQLLYFGLLTKSIFLKDTKKEEAVNLKTVEFLANSIIEKDPKDPFSVLNLPWNASSKEAKRNYHQLVMSIHPHVLPLNTSKQLKEKCEQAIYKITTSYEILKDEKKRSEYLRVQKEEDIVTVMDKYEEGLTKIKQGQYQQGIEILEQISNHKHSPNNTELYILWAKIKGDKNLAENREQMAKIRKAIDSCPISLRTSPLFWYVKGLFCTKTSQYEKADELFRKSLKIEKNFMEAKRELLWLKSKIKKPLLKNKFFNFLLKKSG